MCVQLVVDWQGPEAHLTSLILALAYTIYYYLSSDEKLKTTTSVNYNTNDYHNIMIRMDWHISDITHNTNYVIDHIGIL